MFVIVILSFCILLQSNFVSIKNCEITQMYLLPFLSAWRKKKCWHICVWHPFQHQSAHVLTGVCMLAGRSSSSCELSAPSLSFTSSSLSSSESEGHPNSVVWSRCVALITRHAFAGSKRRRRRQCHLRLSTPIDLSMVLLADRWYWLYASSAGVLAFSMGVKSQSQHVAAVTQKHSIHWSLIAL